MATSSISCSTTKEVEEVEEDTSSRDPLVRNHARSEIVKEGDWILLKFADEKKKLLFLQASSAMTSPSKKNRPVVKLAKGKCTTKSLIGLQYGRVIEQTKFGFIPLDLDAKLIPDLEEDEDRADAVPTEDRPNPRDNSMLIDTNTSQRLDMADLESMKKNEPDKAKIVSSIIENSITYGQKTIFAQEKYVRKKQQKYLSRCRIIRCTALTMCQYLHMKDPKRIHNLRDDTLGQLLAYSNISAGCQTLLYETCLGLLTGAVAERLGGYGRIISIYDGIQPKYREQLEKFNFPFLTLSAVHWVHAGDVYDTNNGRTTPIIGHDGDGDTEQQQQRNGGDDTTTTTTNNNKNYQNDDDDIELQEREMMQWPCYLQPHTRNFIRSELAKTKQNNKRKNGDDGDGTHLPSSSSTADSTFDLDQFMHKRANRFLRKLCRSTPTEARRYLDDRLCDSIILACRYDPIQTLFPLLPYLAPSCPFVVYCEFLEPLVQCFQKLQDAKIAINLRLCDTWMREYQVLEGRTHPFMQMGQNGGYILTGVRLHDTTGQNELDEDVMETAKTKWRKMKRSQGLRRPVPPRPGKKEES